MAEKIKRCLYIGLGGTGMNTLLNVKKMFVETYGEVPPMIGFLGIDTNNVEYNKTLTTERGREITLSPNERLPITVADARPIYDVNKENFSWIPEKNLYALTSMMLGAGQVRTNGRFAFTVNYQNVANKVHDLNNRISSASQINNEKYELINSKTEIFLVFSMCGGTGCGTFLNMAYLLKNEVPNCKITAYAVLPDIFKSMSNSGMSKVAPNAYGAIMDLDYLMHMNMGCTPFNLEYLKDNYEIRERPFNSVVFVDNKNENGDTYNHIDELTEMIALALVTSAGELSSAEASVGDNMEKNIVEGNMDIENKKAWAAGMGICEIVYKSSIIHEIFVMKAAKNLIDRMCNPGSEDVENIVNAWIDSDKVNIRENNNNDHVIDYLLDKNPKYELTINEYANPNPEIEQNIAMNRPKDEDLNVKVSALSSRVRTELRNLIITHINREGGVACAAKIVEGIKSQIDIFLGEMRTEKEEFQDQLPRYKTSVENAVADLKKCDGKVFKKKSTLESYANDVVNAVKQEIVCIREIARRSSAITVFNNIMSMLSEVDNRIQTIGATLKSVYSKLTADLAMIQNNVGQETRTFRIDLAQNAAGRLVVNKEDLLFNGFLQQIPVENKIYGFVDSTVEEIEKILKDFAGKTAVAQKYLNTSIDDIIEMLPEDEFNRCINVAIKKSMPLFRFNYRGHTPSETPRDCFYVGVPDKTTSKLVKDGFFRNKITGNSDVDFSNIGTKERIIIYHQIGVVPAYAIYDINNYRNEYEECCNTDCHFDFNLESRMIREEFDLNPKRITDNDLVELWVKGFIFGLIRNKDNMYQFQSEEFGDILDDNWVSLNKYRDDAFSEFCRYKTSVRKEFNKFIEDFENEKGAEVVKNLVKDVKENYFENYSQINMDKAELKSKGMEKVRKLFTDELEFVKKNL